MFARTFYFHFMATFSICVESAVEPPPTLSPASIRTTGPR